MNKQTELYRYFDDSCNLLYVGISKSAVARASQHQGSSHWYSKHTTMKTERFNTREEALKAEKKAIKTESPLYNKVHSDCYTELNPFESSEDKYIKIYEPNKTNNLNSTEYGMLLFLLRKMSLYNKVRLNNKWTDSYCAEVGLTTPTRKQAARNTISSLLKTDFMVKLDKDKYFINPNYAARAEWSSVLRLMKDWDKLNRS